MKRDVEAFKALLWRWFAAERYRETWEGGAFNSDPEGLARREAATDKAKRALATVLEAFEAEPSNRGMPDHGCNLTAAEVKACGVLPPQNSRDSDFP